MEAILTMFQSVALMAAAVVVISEFVDRFWKLQDWKSQLRSLGIGLAIGEIGAGFSLGMFADPTVIGTNPWWLAGGLIGILAGLTGNWTFATPLVKALLELLKIRPKQT